MAVISDIEDGLSMRAASAKNGVTRQSFLRYVDKSEERADQYARAMIVGCESIADDIIDLADISRRGVKTTIKADGSTETVDGDMVDRARLQVDVRKWLLSKRMPKKYGDKLELGGDPNNPVKVIITATESRL